MVRYTRALIVILWCCYPCARADAEDRGGSTGSVWNADAADHERVAEAVAAGEDRFTLIIASRSGENSRVARRAQDIGGRIEARVDDVDYLRVSLPLSKWGAVGALGPVAAVNVSRGRTWVLGAHDTNGAPTTKVDHAGIPNLPFGGPDSRTPADNPYLAVGDLRVPQFIKSHPTFDGRGTVIGMVDGTPDTSHPAMANALTLDGRPVPKVLDLWAIRGTGHVWLDMHEVVAVSGGKLDWHGRTYTTAEAGVRHVALWGREDGARLVMWDEATDRVWIDADNDGDLVAETPLSDFARNQDTIRFVPAVANEIAQAQTLFIKIDRAGSRVLIGRMSGGHGMHVATAAAGNGLFGGAMHGSAPSAQLVNVLAYKCVHEILEGLIRVMQDARVDAVTLSAIGNYRQNAGRSAFSVIANRLVNRFDKPLFISAGNAGPGINGVNEFASAQGVLSVGGYLSRASWRALLGIESDRQDIVHVRSERGPSESGVMKPDFVAPIAGVFADGVGIRGDVYTSAYELPVGYGMNIGTSFAAPFAAGAAALLISGAKQTNIQYGAHSIATAMRGGARFLDGYGVHDQGAGLIDVEKAWTVLNRCSGASRFETRVARNSRGDDVNEDSPAGFYGREGWRAGQRRAVSVFIRRQGGKPNAVHRLEWIGNAGTFQLEQRTLDLPLHQWIHVRVRVSPGTPGVHSAALKIVDADTACVAHHIPFVLVAAEEFTRENRFTIARSASVSWLGHRSHFFRVPEGVAALRIELEVAKGRLVMQRFRDPVGQNDGFEALRGGFWWLRSQPQSQGRISRTVIRPAPGVWEIVIQNYDDTQDPNTEPRMPTAEYELRASIASVTLDVPHEIRADTAQPEIHFEPSSRFAPVVGRLAETSLGSAREETLTLHGPEAREIEVPRDTESVMADLTVVRGEGSAALFLYDCTDPQEPQLMDYGIGEHAFVRVLRPRAGRWRVVAVPFDTDGSADLQVAYRDIFTHAALGVLKPTSSYSARVIRGQTPETGRSVVAVADVTSADWVVRDAGRAVPPDADVSSYLRPAPLGTSVLALELSGRVALDAPGRGRETR